MRQGGEEARGEDKVAREGTSLPHRGQAAPPLKPDPRSEVGTLIMHVLLHKTHVLTF